MYDRSENAELLKDLSEDCFLFLTDRSDFWRTQKPIYATLGARAREKEKEEARKAKLKATKHKLNATRRLSLGAIMKKEIEKKPLVF